MARSISWALLLCFALLLFSISHGNGRRILVSEADMEKGRFLQELFKETEGMVLLDYPETGPNVNGQSGWTTSLPPPPPPPPHPLPQHPLPPPPPHQKH